MDEWFAIPFDYPPLAGYHLMFPATYRFIREFGGLTYKQKSDGDSWYHQGFTIDPLRGSWMGTDDWFIEEWSAEGALFPLGYDKESRFAITGAGKVIDTNDHVVGCTVEEVITNLVLNRRCGDDMREGYDEEPWVFLNLIRENSRRSVG